MDQARQLQLCRQQLFCCVYASMQYSDASHFEIFVLKLDIA